MEKVVKTEVKKTITYMASDGTRFITESACKEYEDFSIVKRDFKKLYEKLGCEDVRYGYYNIKHVATNPIRLIYSKKNGDDILKLYKMLLKRLYDEEGDLTDIKLRWQEVDENAVDVNIFTEALCEEGKPIIIIQKSYDGDDYTRPSDNTYIITPRSIIKKYELEFHGLFGVDLTNEIVFRKN